MRRDGNSMERTWVDNKNNPVLSCGGEKRIRASLFFNHFVLFFSSLVENPQLYASSKPHSPPFIHTLGSETNYQDWHFHLCLWTETIRRKQTPNAIVQMGSISGMGPSHFACKLPQGRSKNSHFQGAQHAFLYLFAVRTFQWAVVSPLPGRWIYVFVYLVLTELTLTG